MVPVLVLVHTVPSLVDAFTGWCRDELPEVTVSHILDEPLLAVVTRRGHDVQEADERLLAHVTLAHRAGASAVLVTCSTISGSVARIRAGAPIPVIAADDALATAAVRQGHRISLLATAPSTLEPSRERLTAAAAAEGRQVTVESILIEGAFSKLRAGRPDAHDELVSAAVVRAAASADVVVLAQATMARILPMLDGVSPPVPVPVLASPRLALAEVRRVILEPAVVRASAQHEAGS